MTTPLQSITGSTNLSESDEEVSSTKRVFNNVMFSYSQLTYLPFFTVTLLSDRDGEISTSKKETSVTRLCYIMLNFRHTFFTELSVGHIA